MHPYPYLQDEPAHWTMQRVEAPRVMLWTGTGARLAESSQTGFVVCHRGQYYKDQEWVLQEIGEVGSNLA